MLESGGQTQTQERCDSPEAVPRGKAEDRGNGTSGALRDGERLDSQPGYGSSGNADCTAASAPEEEARTQEAVAKLGRYSPIGEKYGKLTVVGVVGRVTGSSWCDRIVLCKCECGKEVERRYLAMRRNTRRGAEPECNECKRTRLVGKVFGKLTVVRELPIDHKKNNRPVECVCECGRFIPFREASDLEKSAKRGRVSACRECLKEIVSKKLSERTTVNRVGRRIGHLTIRSQWRYHQSWHVSCVCDCGYVIEDRVYGELHRREVQDRFVGCEKCREEHYKGKLAGVRTHELPEYSVWSGMRRRCNIPEDAAYKNYGGRGIKLCDEWNGPRGFVRFYLDMGPRPGPEYSIERTNNDLGYSKENCIWATMQDQLSNTRRNVYYLYKGQKMTLPQIARASGTPLPRLRLRVSRGLSAEEAVSLPSPLPPGFYEERARPQAKPTTTSLACPGLTDENDGVAWAEI